MGMDNFQKQEKLPKSATKRSFSVKKIAKVNLCDLLQHFITLITPKFRQDLKDLQLPR